MSYEFMQCFDNYESAYQRVDESINALRRTVNPAANATLQKVQNKHVAGALAASRAVREEIEGLEYIDAHQRATEFMLKDALTSENQLSHTVDVQPFTPVETAMPEFVQVKSRIDDIKLFRIRALMHLEAYQYEKLHILCLKFFDDATQKAIVVGKRAKIQLHCLPNKEKTHYVYPVRQATDEHQHCGVLPGFCPAGSLVEVSLAEPYEVGCNRYVSAAVSFVLRKSGECCTVPVPLHQLPETCTLKLRSYDSSSKDFIEKAESFLSGVEWTITAVKSSVTAHGSTPKFQSWTSTAHSVEGRAEIPEIPLHQLYKIEARGPAGYLTEGPAVHYRYICCERDAELLSVFRPCSRFPKRSIVFVRQECSGARWSNTSVNVGGVDLAVDKEGISNLPADMTGVRTLIALGKVFNPAYLDLREGAPPVSLVQVSDLTGADATSSVRGRFVDQDNLPFVRRPITVLLPNGNEVPGITDDAGYFEVPHGSQVSAREDEWGLSTEPVLVKQI